MTVQVSLAATVLNEGEAIDRLLDSIVAQTRLPDEVIIVDGGSRDDTVSRIAARRDGGFPVPLHLLELPGANISRGRNVAIAAARCDIIAVTDAGVHLEDTWLERLIAPFVAADPPDIVSGFFVPDPAAFRPDAPLFPAALAATTLPAVADIDADTFLPSSRSVAFRRNAWEAAAGYPEWLDYCEDLVFDLTLCGLGRRFVFAPEARVHFAPRPTPRAFYWQYFRYARGDGKADLWRRRHAIRYGTYLGLLAGLIVARRRPAAVVPLALGAAAYCRRPARRLLALTGEWPARRRMGGLALIPSVRLLGDLAKMAGYPAGVWWRIRRR